MFLIRLIHLKKIPKLEELLRNVETSQNKINSKEIETLFSAVKSPKLLEIKLASNNLLIQKY